MSKHKVKQNFTHKGKQHKPGDEFESDDQHEIQTLASQGHIEAQPSQGSQPGGSAGQKTQGQGQDPSKQGQ